MKERNTQRINSINVDWLRKDESTTISVDKDDEYREHPLPAGAGVVNTNLLTTSHNMKAFHVHHDLNSALLGDDFHLCHLSTSFDCSVFMIGVAFNSPVEQKEYIPETTVRFGGELTLFRHANQLEHDVFVKTEKPFDVVFVYLPIHSLNLLIGQDKTSLLLSSLDIVVSPSVVSRTIPLRITNILQSAVSPQLKGSMKKLYAQAKILEYLCELLEYVEQQDGNLTIEAQETIAVHRLYEYLLQLEGKLPSLTELAEQMNMSARSLSNAFRKEFGLTIHRFMAKKRLQEAHSTIQETRIPLKVIAIRLGYSHVNHFNAAFKNEFGYTPGSLRKR